MTTEKRTRDFGSFTELTSRRRLIPRAIKGGLAIMDQALVTGSNFAIGILLARWLLPAQYGAYAVAYAVFLLLVNLYQALVLEPMSVFGASTYANRLRGYLRALLSLHLTTALVIFFALCASAAVVLRLGGANHLPGALTGIALAAPLVLLFWFAKRIFYMQLSPAVSTGGAILYCVLALSSLTLVYRRGLLSPFSAFLIMGVSAFGASIPLFVFLYRRLPSGLAAPSLAQTWSRHWKYGRWALASAAVIWIPTNIFYPLLSSFFGMGHAAELKALANLATPVWQTYGALDSLLLPYLTRIQRQQGHPGTNVVIVRITWFFVAGAGVYWLVLLLAKAEVFRLLYSGRYTEVASLLPIVALGSVFWAARLAPTSALRAMESPASVFFAVCVSAGISIVLGVPASRAFGVKGAVWSIALSEALACVVTTVLYRRKIADASHSVSLPVSTLASAESAGD